MKTDISLPLGSLTGIKSIQMELEMRAKHYQSLLSANLALLDRVLLSILEDLTSPEVHHISYADYQYLVIMSRIATFGGEIEFSTKCPHCKEDIKASFNLTNLKETYADSAPKKIVLYTGKDTQQEFTVIPPTVDVEIAIREKVTPSGKMFEDVFDSPDLIQQFANLRIGAHISRSTDLKEIETLMSSILEFNSVPKYKELASIVTEYAQYGLDFVAKDLKCPKCKEGLGGVVIPFRLAVFSKI